jgi:hypothetical protein
LSIGAAVSFCTLSPPVRVLFLGLLDAEAKCELEEDAVADLALVSFTVAVVNLNSTERGTAAATACASGNGDVAAADTPETPDESVGLWVVDTTF